ncbi:MAG TPA: helix-turn-helix transcriptional regulator, partial [Streptosporangiaceae bacterium]|nr:helix-turn-helix transcriptional regulator [Streptosporangiaceae bacterium]
MTAIGTVPAPVTGDDPLGLADLGRQVRETRRSLNMSQLALGRELGYSQSSVARIEAGEKPLTPEGRRAVLAGIAALGSDGHVPWFGPWLHAERTATALRSWEGPLIP